VCEREKERERKGCEHKHLAGCRCSALCDYFLLLPKTLYTQQVLVLLLPEEEAGGGGAPAGGCRPSGCSSWHTNSAGSAGISTNAGFQGRFTANQQIPRFADFCSDHFFAGTPNRDARSSFVPNPAQERGEKTLYQPSMAVLFCFVDFSQVSWGA